MNMSQNKPNLRTVIQPEFASAVLQSSKPVLVVFFATWSRPCQVLEATLNEIVTACDGQAEFIKINADDHPDLSLCYDVHSVPTLLYFVGGRVQARMVGTASKEAILAKLNLLNA